MIGLNELKRRAAEAKATLETIEIDYVLAWLLWGFFHNGLLEGSLVFKGGTALRKVYFPDDTEYRYSEDLDFTAKREFPEHDLREAIGSSCALIGEASNIDIELNRLDCYPSFLSKAYKGRLYFKGPRRQRDYRRLNVDIDCSERLTLPPSLPSVGHHYSDADDCRILVPTYPLEEILAEKLRALITPGRIRARHFFDVWYILLRYPGRVSAREIRQVFHRKCRHKKIEFSGTDDFFRPARRAKYEDDWKRSLEHLMQEVPPFQRVHDELKYELQNLFG